MVATFLLLLLLSLRASRFFLCILAKGGILSVVGAELGWLSTELGWLGAVKNRWLSDRLEGLQCLLD